MRTIRSTNSKTVQQPSNIPSTLCLSFITKSYPQLLKDLELGAIRQCIRKNDFQCDIAGENEVTSKPNGREPTPSKLVQDFVSVVVDISEVDGMEAPVLVFLNVFYIVELGGFVSS